MAEVGIEMETLYVDDLGLQLETLKELVIETLADFDERVTAAAEATKQEVSLLKDDILNLTELPPVTLVPEATLVHTASAARESPLPVILPQEVADLTSDWREKLEPFQPEMVYAAEKLNNAQLALFAYCFDSSEAPMKPNKKCANKIAQAGFEAGVWNREHLVYGEDLIHYLTEKIRTTNRKRRKAEERWRLAAQFSSEKQEREAKKVESKKRLAEQHGAAKQRRISD